MATAAEWSKRVAAWRASGQHAEEYASAHGWRGATLRWWSSRLKRQPADALSAPSVAVHFARVVAKPAAPSSLATACIEVVLSRGRTLRVSAGFSPELLRSVIETLEQA
jgi:hypothetical protein